MQLISLKQAAPKDSLTVISHREARGRTLKPIVTANISTLHGEHMGLARLITTNPQDELSHGPHDLDDPYSPQAHDSCEDGVE